MEYHVCSIEQNMQGTWDARVCITEEETAFFNFGNYPSDEEIQGRAFNLVYERELAAYLEEQKNQEEFNATME
jgi:hypothetical protein